MLKRILIGLMAIAMATAFNAPAAFGVELAKEQVLVMPSAGRDIQAVDPAFSKLGSEVFLATMMFNALVRYPPGDGGNIEALEPDLAERWDISKDGIVWTFYLRKGVKFHKGYGEMTAEDVKFSYERMSPKREGSPWSKEFKKVKSIEIIDKYTVRFTLENPDPYFLMKVANYHSGYIVCKKAREELGEAFRTEPVGTGPFQVLEYKPKDKYVLVRHDDYFRGKPILEKVIAPFMPTDSSRTLALKKGVVDLCRGRIDMQWVNNMKETTKIIVDAKYALGSHSCLHFNMTRKPMDDIRVRKALAYGIDRDELVRFWGKEIAVVAYTHVPPNAFGGLKPEELSENLRYDYNPEKAKQLLKEAGYPNGFTLKKVYVTESQVYRMPFIIIQEQLRKIGVNLELEIVDHSTYHANIRKDLNSLVMYNASRPPIGGIYLEHWYHSNSIIGKKTAITNFSHYGDVDADGDGDVSDNNIDAYIDKGWVEMDPNKVKEMYRRAQIQLLTDLPTFPLIIRNYVLVRQPWVNLGYEPKGSMIYHYHVTEKTSILKH